MKKIISLVLALVMVMGMATTAFADEVTSPTTLTDEAKSVDIPVTGEYIEQLKSDEIISVDVAWGAMDFTYAASFQGTWNPVDHSYTKDTAHNENGDWVDNSADITVTNHSNVDITATFSFKADENHDTVTGSFDKDSADLTAGVVNKYANADSKTVTFTIGGSLANTVTTSTQIGTITVSVGKKEQAPTSKTIDYLTRTAPGVHQGDGVEYNYYDGHDPDWSALNLCVMYTDGTYDTITAASEGVTRTYTDNSLEYMKANAQTGSCEYTFSYKGKTLTIKILASCWSYSNGQLPTGVYAQI